MNDRLISLLAAMVCIASGNAQSNTSSLTIPQGTAITVRTIDKIESKKADLDRDYAASIGDPVTVNGVVLIPQGTSAILRIREAKGTKGLWGRASLKLKLIAVMVNGQRLYLDAEEYSSESGSQGAKTAKHAGVGAAAGAGIGALAGGGLGAVIGALAGGGAGAAEGAIRGEKITIAAETKLSFQLTQPLQMATPNSAPAAAQAPPSTNRTIEEKAPPPLAPPPPPR